MSTTAVLKCNCVHKTQDLIYGKSMRVHNLTNLGTGNQMVWRCTVCLKTRQSTEKEKIYE